MTTISTTTSWAARLPRHVFQSLAAFRTLPNLQGCKTDCELWVRGETSPDNLPQQIRLTTGAEVFAVTAGGELIPWGCRVPVGQLPDGPWVALADLLTPNFPTARFAPRLHPQCELKLIRSETGEEPAVLEVELASWSRFVRESPRVRLMRWEFAASTTGRVLIRGLPLPALPGRRYWHADGMLIPVGYRWFPEVAAHVVRRILQLPPDEWAVWSPESCRWERIPTDAFVPARRENVHQTVIERTAAEAHSS